MIDRATERVQIRIGEDATAVVSQAHARIIQATLRLLSH